MRQVLVVAAASVREHSRRKLIAFFLVLSLLVMGLLMYLARSPLSDWLMGPAGTIAAIAALGVMQLLALIATLAVSMGNIGQPFSSGEALPVLARPVSRHQYALGRYFGSGGVIVGLCLLFALQTQAIQLVATGGLIADVWGHWATVAFNLLVIAAVTTLISVFSPVPVLAAIVGFLVNQGIGGVAALYRLTRAEIIEGTIARIVEVLWYVSPKFLISPLEESQMASMSGGELPGELAGLIVHNSPGLFLWAAAWLVGLVALSLLLAGRKEV